jgi:cell division septation protein DedD
MEVGEIEGETAAVSKGTTTGKPQQPEMQDFSGLEGYVVQIGSYSTYDFAQMLAAKYQKRDYPAFVQATNIGDQTYYRLRVGVYETLDDAKQIAQLMSDRYSVEYWIDYNR